MESNQSNMQLTGASQEFLLETTKWTRFLSILGFVGIGILIIFALFAGAIFSNLPTNGPGSPTTAFPGAMFTVIYLIMAVVYYFPVRYLYNFSVQMRNALSSKINEEVEEALMNLKSHYKFMGIASIIVLSLYVLGALMGILIALFAR